MALDYEQLLIVRSLMRTIWKDVMPDQSSMIAWQESFEPYSFDAVETAVRQYIACKPFKPNPADIIGMIPAPEPMEVPEVPKPTYEVTPEGERIRVYKCKRCRDLGLIMWRDDEDRPYGRPCTCDAGLARYSAARKKEERH